MAFGLAHLYDRRRGNPGWSRPAWGLAGADPAVSEYDRNFGDSETPFHRQIAAGLFRSFDRLPLDAPTLNRNGRVAAQHNTLPAARFFQSYTESGTGRSFSPATTPHLQGTLNKNFNPNMQGAAELHPATTYDPFPSPASLYPKVV